MSRLPEYTELLGAHLLATIRETWAVAPSLTNLRVAGLRKRADGPRDVLFDVDVSRADGHWADDRWGDTLLAHVPGGLNRVGGAQEGNPGLARNCVLVRPTFSAMRRRVPSDIEWSR